MANVTFEDKDKNVKDGVHNYLRDIDANEIKRAVNSKIDADKIGTANGVAPLDGDGKIPAQYVDLDGAVAPENIPFTPAGNIAATNVRDAIAELDAEKQAALGYNPENVGNKATNLSSNTSNTLYPTVKAVADGDTATLNAAKAYADSVNVNVLNYRGYWDASGGTVYPSTGGTGSAGAIQAGNTWEISVAGGGYDVGDLIVAKIAAPGQTAANWGKTAHNTQQATELARGTAMLATTAEMQDKDTTNDIDMVTPKKLWVAITYFLTLAWTFVEKITFTLAPRFSSASANSYLKTDGNKDLTSVSSIPGADVAAATDTARGTAELATDTEVKTATDSVRIVTPSGLNSRLKRLPVLEFPADFVATANISLSNTGQVIQGVATTAGMIGIVAGQTIATQNGLYIVDAGAWLRIGVSYNNDVYNYNGNFEGLLVYNRKDKKFYIQTATVAEIASSGQVWAQIGSGSGGGGGGADTFTSDIVVALDGGKTFGKYSNGDTIPANGKTAVQVILDAAIQYLEPLFNSFAITGQASSIESGDSIASGSKAFTWGALNPTNIASNSIAIRNQTANTDLATGLTNDGGESVNLAAPIQLNGDNVTQTFRIQATKANGGVGTFFLDLVITSYYKIFYGPASAAPANSAAVRALANNRLRNAGNVFTMNTGTTEKIFALWLPTGRTLVSIIDRDAADLDLTASYVSSSLQVQDAGGTLRNGTLYVLTNTVPYGSNHRHEITIS